MKAHGPIIEQTLAVVARALAGASRDDDAIPDPSIAPELHKGEARQRAPLETCNATVPDPERGLPSEDEVFRGTLAWVMAGDVVALGALYLWAIGDEGPDAGSHYRQIADALCKPVAVVREAVRNVDRGVSASAAARAARVRKADYLRECGDVMRELDDARWLALARFLERYAGGAQP